MVARGSTDQAIAVDDPVLNLTAERGALTAQRIGTCAVQRLRPARVGLAQRVHSGCHSDSDHADRPDRARRVAAWDASVCSASPTALGTLTARTRQHLPIAARTSTTSGLRFATRTSGRVDRSTATGSVAGCSAGAAVSRGLPASATHHDGEHSEHHAPHCRTHLTAMVARHRPRARATAPAVLARRSDLE